MYLALLTHFVWEIEGKIDAAQFFEALPILCSPGDVLAIGTYWARPDITAWLTAQDGGAGMEKPFSDTFDFNRDKYPQGRAYLLRCGDEQLRALAEFSRAGDGGVEKALFFDHVFAWRTGELLVPLVYAHDAFALPIWLSGHYSPAVAQRFAAALGLSACWIENPDYATRP